MKQGDHSRFLPSMGGQHFRIRKSFRLRGGPPDFYALGFNRNKWRGKRWTPSPVKGTRLVLQANEQVHIYPTVREINSFFLIAT